MNDYRGLLIKKQRKALDISLEALSHGVCCELSNRIEKIYSEKLS